MSEGAPRSYRLVVGFMRLLVRAFFRRVVVTGIEQVPKHGGGIVVSWHPNGLIDPGLVLTQMPRQVVFGARHGIFRWPVLGQLMRQIGTVPIYRRVDLPKLSKAERGDENARSLDALSSAVAQGSFAALFPEGVSHDAPHLMELKTGAARLFYRALSMQSEDQQPAIILPVGLHYDQKDLFRSSALVSFHPPIELSGKLAYDPDLDDEQAREQARTLTAEIERVLQDVVLATDSWPLHQLMHRARKLVRAERAKRAGALPPPSTLGERVLGFARIRAGYNALVNERPAEVEALLRRMENYDEDLSALGLRSADLDRSPRLVAPWLAALLLLQVLTVFFVLPPLMVVGWVVNGPAALLLLLVSWAASKRRKDEATIKVLVGALLFPLSWIGAGIGATYAHTPLHAAFPSIPDTPILAGLMVSLLAAAGGAAAVRYLRVARETARAVRVRLTRQLRRRAIERLRTERADLHDALIDFVEGVELPGAVASDGRVVAVGDDTSP